jgi:hypothetical protein
LGLEKMEENWELYTHRAPRYEVEFDLVVVHFDLTKELDPKVGLSRDQVGTKSGLGNDQGRLESQLESRLESGAQSTGQVSEPSQPTQSTDPVDRPSQPTR